MKVPIANGMLLNLEAPTLPACEAFADGDEMGYLLGRVAKIKRIE